MIRHFKIWVALLGFILVILIIVFTGSLYVGSCSYHNNCLDGGRAQASHTPIPTLIPAALPSEYPSFPYSSDQEKCKVTAEMLLSAWVSAGYSEDQAFFFNDNNNIACQATFADVRPLFVESNFWYPGALGCTTCHNANFSTANSALLDLSSYGGIVTGSHRSPQSTTGVDILGAGDWSKSRLNQVLFVLRQMPINMPVDVVAASGPILFAGIPVSVANATPEATQSQPEIARPNTPGGAGNAINLSGDVIMGKQIFIDRCQLCHGLEGQGNVLNPGSDDGTVPPLNPIDSTILSPDENIFSYNLDLFLQNGSRPSGLNPSRFMPPWGAQNGLTQQQIADVIAYIISLNK